ncbi:DUF4435 domain-containing protein [Photobacterium sp. GB-210]|uniref:DUF4435 domain-containing protein n=1 Tax=Photobacterium sp. GB-210 TaxID=2022104 RepID=UPI000D160218|nr:DUF4435 domain-containing protein [Photobacterium sp. GB-210]PSV38596.1 hypothetical protein C9J38_08990 [Photobacterium sp. GB-210]
MLDYLVDPDYIKAHGIFKYQNQERGFIYIENEKDISFWELFFGPEILKNYEFNMASGPGAEDDSTRGKKRFEDLLKKANKLAVFAVDADFDHLTPNRFPKCKEICDNKFVIHTYGYSKESYLNSASVLNDCLSKYAFYKPSGLVFCEFLRSYSNSIYDVLVKYLYLLNTNPEFSNEKVFHDAITPRHDILFQMYFESNYAEFNATLQTYEAKLDDALKEINLDAHFSMCKSYNLTPDTAYQYINGHVLENRIIDCIVNEIRRRLSVEELHNFKNSGATGKDINNRKNEISNFFKNERNFSTMRSTSNKYEYEELFAHARTQLECLQTN